MKLAILILFLVLTTFQAQSQPGYDPQTTLAVNALKEDLSVLRTVLENVHGGLYRYSSKRTMDSLFDSAVSKIQAPMTEVEFFRIITPVIVAIKDEHTFALPSEEYFRNEIGPTVYSASVTPSKVKLFPFFIKILNNQIYIQNNLSEDLSLNTADEIVSINGVRSPEVLKTLLATIPSNGDIETFKIRHLEQFSLQQTYNRFMVHYAIFIGQPEKFEIQIRRAGTNQLQAVSINALTSDKIFNNYWRRYSTVNDSKKIKENPLGFQMEANGTAYLRLSDFHNPVWSKYNYSFSTEFRNIFKAIRAKGVKDLIIDLRDNEGGNFNIGAELLKYVCTSAYKPYNYHEVQRYKFSEYKKYFRDSSSTPNYPDELFTKSANGLYRSNPEYRTETMSRQMQPDTLAFNKKVYVLINGATGSAASILATVIRVNRTDAIFVGEESGGDMSGPISGGGTDITLPNSKIRVDVPFIRRVVNLNSYKAVPNHGIIPDHQVAVSPSDIAGNIDSELRYTYELIRKKP